MPWMAIVSAGASLLGGKEQADAAGSASEAQARSAEAAIAENRRQFDLGSTEQRRQYDTTRADYEPFRKTGVAANARLARLLGINPANDPSGDPRYESIYNRLMGELDNAHIQQYGMPFAQSPDEASKAIRLREVQEAAQREFGALPPAAVTAGDPQAGELTRRFTAADLEADPVYKSGLQFGLDQGRDAINARATQAGGYDSGATLKALTRWGNDYGSTKAGESENRFRVGGDTIYNRLAGVSGAGQTATGSVASAGSNMVNANSAAGTNFSNANADLLTGAGNARAAGVVGRANAWSGAMGGVNDAVSQYQKNERFKRLYPTGGGGYGTPNPWNTWSGEGW